MVICGCDTHFAGKKNRTCDTSNLNDFININAALPAVNDQTATEQLTPDVLSIANRISESDNTLGPTLGV